MPGMSDTLSRFVRRQRDYQYGANQYQYGANQYQYGANQYQYGANQYQYGRDYIFCSSFLNGPLGCPVCLERFSWNNSMQVLHCEYRSEGCPVVLPLKYLFTHQQSCQFSTYFCNVEVNGVRCCFIGSLQLLTNHLWRYHMNDIYIQNRRSALSFQLAELAPWTQWHGIINAHSEFFICVLKAYQTQIIGYTVLLGPANRSTLYTQETTFMNSGQMECISFQRAVVSVHFDEPYIFRSGAFFEVTFDAVGRLMSAQHSLQFKIKIKKTGSNSLSEVLVSFSATLESQSTVFIPNDQTSDPNAQWRRRFKPRSAVQNRPPCFRESEEERIEVPHSTTLESIPTTSASNEWTGQNGYFDPSTARENHRSASTQNESGGLNIATPVEEHNEVAEEQCTQGLLGSVESKICPDQNVVEKSPVSYSAAVSQMAKKKGRKGRVFSSKRVDNLITSEDAASQSINAPETGIESVYFGKESHSAGKTSISKVAEESTLQSKAASKSEVDTIDKQKYFPVVYTGSKVGQDNANNTPIAISDTTSSSSDETSEVSKISSKCLYKPKAQISPFGSGIISMSEIHEGNEIFSERHDIPEPSVKYSSCDQVYDEARAIQPANDPYFTQIAEYNYFNPSTTTESNQEQRPSLLSWAGYEPQANKKVSPLGKADSVYKSKLPNLKTAFPSVDRAGFSEASSKEFCETRFSNRSTTDKTSIFQPYPLPTLQSGIINGKNHLSPRATSRGRDDIKTDPEVISHLLSSLSQSLDLLPIPRSPMPTESSLDSKNSKFRSQNNAVEETAVKDSFVEKDTQGMEFKNSFPDVKSKYNKNKNYWQKVSPQKRFSEAVALNKASAASLLVSEQHSFGKFKNAVNDKSENVVNHKSKNAVNGKFKNVVDDKFKNVVDDKFKNVVDDKSKNVVNDKTKNMVSDEARAADQGKDVQNTVDPVKVKKRRYFRRQSKRSGNSNDGIVYYYKQL